ncbi:hypothetical protein OQA88_5134 [Cercophora sp. LCS_1]
MQLSAILASLLLPLVAVANPSESLSTTTCTSYETLTKTITLQRAAVETVSAGSNTSVVLTTPSAGFKPTTTAPLAPASTGGASGLEAARLAMVAVAGVAAAALL